MAKDRKMEIQPVDLVGIGNLLEQLITKDIITCKERDKIIQRITKDSNLAKHTLSILTGYGHSKDEVLERVADKDSIAWRYHNLDESYMSLTEIVRAHSDDAPGYVIQSWLRDGNTLAFLNLWEKENNPDYCEDEYPELLEKKRRHPLLLPRSCGSAKQTQLASRPNRESLAEYLPIRQLHASLPHGLLRK